MWTRTTTAAFQFVLVHLRLNYYGNKGGGLLRIICFSVFYITVMCISFLFFFFVFLLLTGQNKHYEDDFLLFSDICRAADSTVSATESPPSLLLILAQK